MPYINSIEDLINALKVKITELFREYNYLNYSRKIESYFKEDFNEYISGNITKEALKNSLEFLSHLLHVHNEKNSYILIDEYDKPVNMLLELSPINHNLLKEAVELITSILAAAGKDNRYREKLILTGIFDTLKRESDSGFNQCEYLWNSKPNFGRSFGFSGEEVRNLVAKLMLGDKENSVNENIRAGIMDIDCS
ncbi:MAG: putative protein conserved in bacteria [Candidatus Midichloria mitochondrii]|nr:AAA family ATPase [Candidatus Midichloria mitochondrii]MDJ1256013.1 AAA family ATPase [Candidatus Midichloria mitochondrii]MDJ1287712.1 AAA family ATPase [Candidatus Midichloria mitochondrii]MDJ1298575.1 AAA family ATPase [Candidatus Midichloria mitochondrii]MDJ1312725.1 AAA family ATPase [Candidatus Midichloria mitochondrii]MDJ1583292.1 AAA family ATPase [Candidatus Midichloria mitochondrii]